MEDEQSKSLTADGTDQESEAANGLLSPADGDEGSSAGQQQQPDVDAVHNGGVAHGELEVAACTSSALLPERPTASSDSDGTTGSMSLENNKEPLRASGRGILQISLEDLSSELRREDVKNLEVEEELKRAYGKVAEMREELTNSKTERHNLATAMSEANSAKIALERELHIVKTALEEKSRVLEASNVALQQSSALNRKVQGDLDRLRKELEISKRQYMGCHEMLEMVRRSKDEADELVEEHKRMLQQEIDAQKRGDEDKARKWKAALENADKQHRDALEKMRSLQQALDKAREEQLAGEERETRLQSQLDAAKQQHAGAVEAAGKLRQALNKVKEEHQETMEEARKLYTSLTEARENGAMSEKRAQSLQEEVEKLLEELGTTKERERSLQKEIDGLRKERESVKGEEDGRKRVMDDLVTKLEMLQLARAEAEERAEKAEQDSRMARVSEARAKAMAGAAESRMVAAMKESEMRLAAAVSEAEGQVAASQREMTLARQAEAKALALVESLRKECNEDKRKYQLARAEAEDVSALARMAKEEMEVTTQRSREAEERAEARAAALESELRTAESQARILNDELELVRGQMRGLKMQLDAAKERAEEDAVKYRKSCEDVTTLQEKMQGLVDREKRAIEKAEEAETAKLVVERQLRVWRSEAEPRKRGSGRFFGLDMGESYLRGYESDSSQYGGVGNVLPGNMSERQQRRSDRGRSDGYAPVLDSGSLKDYGDKVHRHTRAVSTYVSREPKCARCAVQ